MNFMVNSLDDMDFGTLPGVLAADILEVGLGNLYNAESKSCRGEFDRLRVGSWLHKVERDISWGVALLPLWSGIQGSYAEMS